MTTLVILQLFLFSNAHADPSLRAAIQNSQPKYIVTSDGMEGMCSDIYKRLRERLTQRDIELQIDAAFTPIKRILSRLEHGNVDLFCGAGRNKKREQRFIYSTAPIYLVANVVAAHKDDPYTPASIQQMSDDGVTVGALFGTSSAAYLKNHSGIKVFDRFHDLDEPLRWIGAKKLRLFYYHDLGLNYLVKHSPHPLRVVKTKFRTTPQWIIFSKKTPAHLVNIMDKEISEMVATGEMKQITKKYID